MDKPFGFGSALVVFLLLGGFACNAGSFMKGKTHKDDKSPAGNQKAEDLEVKNPDSPKGTENGGSVITVAKEEEGVAPPVLISGSYLVCPVLEDSGSQVKIGCGLENESTKEPVAMDEVFRSADFSLNRPENVILEQIALPSASLWSYMILLKFKTEIAKQELLPGIRLNFAGSTLDGKLVKIENHPIAPVPKFSGLKGAGGDAAIIGGSVDNLSSMLLGFDGPQGLETAWSIDSLGVLRNPLGRCVSAIESTLHQFDCLEGMPTKFLHSSNGHIGVDIFLTENLCVAIGPVSTPPLGSPEGLAPQYDLVLETCDELNPKQKFVRFEY